MPNRSFRSALMTAGIVCASIASIAPATSFAQLNLQQFGIGGNKTDAANPNAGAAQLSALSSLVQNYLGANQQVLSGQSNLASAMGMSGVASQAQSASSLLSGATDAGGVNPDVLSQSLMQAFSGGSATPLTADNKQTFSQGLASLGQGVKQYAGLQSNLSSVKNSMNVGSLLQAGSNPGTAQTALYIAQSAPGQLQSLVQTLTQAVQYAKTNGISVPSVASSALSGMQ
ncbi:hypothetical protein BHUM_01304c [Candidatus Burkholderia humilis]|nr:hypothetical protein BHUM_01304c [Candidatus Burkholderia humilis]